MQEEPPEEPQGETGAHIHDSRSQSPCAGSGHLGIPEAKPGAPECSRRSWNPRQDALKVPQLSSHPRVGLLWQPKVKCSKFGRRRRAGASGPIVGPPELRRPERPVGSGRFRRVWAGWPRSGCQLRSGLHPCETGRADRTTCGHRGGGGRQERERGGHLAAPRRAAASSTGSRRACDSQAPAGGSGIPGLLGRGQRPRPVPCPGARQCPGSAGGRARARPGTEARERAGGRRGAGPGRAGACSPAGPPRAARPPAKPGPAPAPGFSRNNLGKAAARRPRTPAGAPGRWPARVSARTALPRQGSGPGLPVPRERLPRANRRRRDRRAPGTQSLR